MKTQTKCKKKLLSLCLYFFNSHRMCISIAIILNLKIRSFNTRNAIFSSVFGMKASCTSLTRACPVLFYLKHFFCTKFYILIDRFTLDHCNLMWLKMERACLGHIQPWLKDPRWKLSRNTASSREFHSYAVRVINEYA